MRRCLECERKLEEVVLYESSRGRMIEIRPDYISGREVFFTKCICHAEEWYLSYYPYYLEYDSIMERRRGIC